MNPRSAIALLLLALAGFSCGRQDAQTDTRSSADSTAIVIDTATAADTTPFAAFDTISPDSPKEFERKRLLLLSCVPSQRSRVEFVLKDVSRIILFEELGLGERLELTAPSAFTKGWPTGMSINRRFGEGKTTLALRFVLDTLAGPRLPGISRLLLLGADCADDYGPNVTFSGVYTGQGAVTLFFENNMPYVEIECCNQGPHMALSTFGVFGDTLMALYTFDPQRLEYGIQLIGPRSSRGFPRFGYVNFRTERGGLHPELVEYPYSCRRSDSGSVDLAIGITRRQILDQTEPRLRVTIF